VKLMARRNIKIVLTDEQLRAVITMRADMKSWSEIARVLSICHQSMYVVAQRHGLKTKPDRPAPDMSKLDTLTQCERNVWRLVDIEKKRPSSLAKELNLSKNTVFSYLGKARRKLGSFTPDYHGVQQKKVHENDHQIS